MEHPFKFIWLSQPWYCILLPLYNLFFFTELQLCSILHLTCNVVMTLCRISEFDTVAVPRPTNTRPGHPGTQSLPRTIYSLLTVGTYKYVKDTIDAKNANRMFKFGSALKKKEKVFWKGMWKCLLHQVVISCPHLPTSSSPYVPLTTVCTDTLNSLCYVI